MKVSILYFASLREAVGLANELVELPQGVQTTGDVLRYLQSRGEPWQAALDLSKGLRCAVNQEVVGVDELVANGAEIAFFPPVTGG